jgi:hypothetical protein
MGSTETLLKNHWAERREWHLGYWIWRWFLSYWGFSKKVISSENSEPTGYLRIDICSVLPPDHLLLDRSPNIGPLISRWELDKFKNFRNNSFRTSKILTLLYQQFSNLLISQRDMSGPRLRALSNNRWFDSNDVCLKRIPWWPPRVWSDNNDKEKKKKTRES